MESAAFRQRTPHHWSDGSGEVRCLSPVYLNKSRALDQCCCIIVIRIHCKGSPQKRHLGGRYSRVLAHYPYIILGTVSVFATTCLVVIVTIGDWPDFTEPRLGFEARGTEIGKRLLSYELLLENTVYSHVPSPQNFMAQVSEKTPPSRQRNKTRGAHGTMIKETRNDRDTSGSEHGYSNGTAEPFFCDVPRAEYARVVFTQKDSETLFTRANIQAMCTIEQRRFHSSPAYREACIHRLSARECCRSWSLGNYVALLSNRSSCFNITDGDVHSVYDRLKRCAPLYNNGTLTAACSYPGEVGARSQCRLVPDECKEHNAVYDILHYLTDMNFLGKNAVGMNPKLRYGLTFLPMAAGIGTKEFYTEIESQDLEYDDVRIIGLNLGIKEDLFNFYLKKDALWFIVAFLAILLSMWFYTASLFLTTMTIVSIFLSLEISYFLYTMVYEIEFFPFKNLLAVVILLGIGADDVFIYSRVWALAKLEKNAGTLEKIVSDTLKHAALSMFVTSLTTSAAFFANYVSDITALKCFALFAGTVVMVNFLLMVTWIPAAMVVHEKWCVQCCGCSEVCAGNERCAHYLCRSPYVVHSTLADWSKVLFEKFLPCVIIRARHLWLVLFGLLGLVGIVVIFYFPKLKLPSTSDFQVFAQRHPFEVYDFEVKEQLWFEKSTSDNTAYMPIVVVWGVRAADNGNKLDPYDDGELEYDRDFDVAAPESQAWLRAFCQKVRASDFYQLEYGLHLTNCFIDGFVQFMKRSCVGFGGESYDPCCGNPPFPYEAPVFRQCIEQWLPLLQQGNPYYTVNPRAGLRFSRTSGRLVGVVVSYLSQEPYSLNYDKMHRFYTELETWIGGQLDRAPPGLRNGWFISDLEFYDLQHSIARGTPVAIAVSIVIASAVVFVTTLNVFVTLYAMLSISFTIFVTVGALVLLGWELNILEAATITVAVGLSIDFTLHYGVAYRLSPDHERQMRVACATGRVGGPVAMAALTTFLAGALVVPSTVLAYRQLGVFLMLNAAISWLYSTFFFQSLLNAVGPQGGFGQLHWPSFECCANGGQQHKDKTVYAVSESTLSSSSANHANSSETHELEPLTDQEHDAPSNCTSTSGNRLALAQTTLDPFAAGSSETVDVGSYPDSSVSYSDGTACSQPRSQNSYHDNRADSEACAMLLSGERKTAVFDSNRNSCGSDVWVKQSHLL